MAAHDRSKFPATFARLPEASGRSNWLKPGGLTGQSSVNIPGLVAEVSANGRRAERGHEQGLHVCSDTQRARGAVRNTRVSTNSISSHGHPKAGTTQARTTSLL